MKRYIYIIIGIIVAAVIAILVLLFIKDRSSSSPTISSGTTTGSLPAVGTQTNPSGTAGGTTANNSSPILALPSSSSTVTSQTGVGSFGFLSSSPVLDYFVGPNNNITAIQPDGQIIAIANGQSSTLSSSTTDDVISASFSYDGEKALVNFGDPTNPKTLVFDVKTQTWTSLPQGLLSPQWSPNTYQIAYLSSEGTGKLGLSLINAANLKAGTATLLVLNANDLDLSWPNKTQFVLSDKPTYQDNGSVWVFNSTNNTLTSLAYENAGVESVWSHNTSTLGLVFAAGSSGQSPTLQLETGAGTLLQQLNFMTLPSKCTFDTEQYATSTTAATSSAYLALYCGIPRASSALSSARLPDDYNTMALFTSDDIYKINTATGETQALWNDQTQNMDTSDIKIFNNTLFFINRYNNELYGLVLGNN